MIERLYTVIRDWDNITRGPRMLPWRDLSPDDRGRVRSGVQAIIDGRINSAQALYDSLDEPDAWDDLLPQEKVKCLLTYQVGVSLR